MYSVPTAPKSGWGRNSTFIMEGDLRSTPRRHTPDLAHMSAVLPSVQSISTRSGASASRTSSRPFSRRKRRISASEGP